MSQHHRATALSSWLEWNKALLDLWNLAVVPWVKTEALAQGVNRGIESFLVMDSASLAFCLASFAEPTAFPLAVGA